MIQKWPWQLHDGFVGFLVSAQESKLQRESCEFEHGFEAPTSEQGRIRNAKRSSWPWEYLLPAWLPPGAGLGSSQPKESQEMVSAYGVGAKGALDQWLTAKMFQDEIERAEQRTWSISNYLVDGSTLDSRNVACPKRLVVSNF